MHAKGEKPLQLHSGWLPSYIFRAWKKICHVHNERRSAHITAEVQVISEEVEGHFVPSITCILLTRAFEVAKQHSPPM